MLVAFRQLLEGASPLALFVRRAWALESQLPFYAQEIHFELCVSEHSLCVGPHRKHEVAE